MQITETLLLAALRSMNGLNESNVIEKIKDGLRIYPSVYQEWERKNFDMEHKFDGESTLLTVAAKNELTEIAKLLIGKGANVNAKRNDGTTPLHYAARSGYTEILEALLQNRADVNALGKDNLTPLHYAAMKDETEVVKALLEKGANIDAVDKNKITPLHYAAQNGHTDIVKVLLEKEASVNTVEEDGWTPLHCAVNHSKRETAETLLKGDAPVNAAKKDGRTPLHLAALGGDEETMKLLLEHDALIDIKDNEGRTPLHFAADKNHIEAVKFLIDNGANVDAMDTDGWTPLFWAAYHGHTELVKTLIEKGAKSNIVDKGGQNPLYYAVAHSDMGIVETFLESGAEVNISDTYERTPLYWAAIEGNEEMVKSLLAKKADPLLGSKSVRMLKPLVELIKNGSLKSAKQGQVDDEYDLIKYSLLLRSDCPFIDVVRRDTFDKLIHTWFSDVSDLTEEQKKLNKELLSILKNLPHLAHADYKNQVKGLGNFLRKNANNGDLKRVLNLQRGESKLTILHIMSSLNWSEVGECVNSLMEAGADPNICDDTGKTPLHCAARFGCSTFISFLLSKGALNIPDKKGKTPLDIAIENHNYHVEVCFLTGEQQDLMEKLCNNITDPNKLQELLNEHKNNQDLKKCLVLRDREGKSQILQHARNVLWNNGTLCKRIESLLLEARAIDYKGLDGKEDVPKSGVLWGNLVLNQEELLKKYLDEVNKAQSMSELQQLANEAIADGVRFNFPNQGSLHGTAYESRYSFMDCVVS